jgi:hypothetical protein
MSIAKTKVTVVSGARQFFKDVCTDDEITMLLEGEVITMGEGDSVYDAEFDDEDEGIITDVLNLRKEKYIIDFREDNEDGYFVITEILE